MFSGLQPLLARLPTPNPYINDRTYTLSEFQKLESHFETTEPTLPYNLLLQKAYISFGTSLGLATPSESDARKFGDAIGAWVAFPDTVAALHTLKKYYKLIILSNIDNATIRRTIAGPLKGAEFDAVYTAQDIGSYKPDLRNFEYLVEHAKGLGVEKGEILHTAQSLTHDHVPAKKMGMTSSWIAREDVSELLQSLGDKVAFTWRFATLGEMAEEVERAFGDEGKGK
ncbi:hypothetical protein B7494_g7505 [Chlorociboria aeruginascens]|nr:hypothetical protein B7494_g7505 [Chlorociboria aeruginascens]